MVGNSWFVAELGDRMSQLKSPMIITSFRSPAASSSMSPRLSKKVDWESGGR